MKDKIAIWRNPRTRQYVIIAAETINGLNMVRIIGNFKNKWEAEEMVDKAREEARFGKGIDEIQIG